MSACFCAKAFSWRTWRNGGPRRSKLPRNPPLPLNASARLFFCSPPTNAGDTSGKAKPKADATPAGAARQALAQVVFEQLLVITHVVGGGRMHDRAVLQHVDVVGNLDGHR